jgi:D-galactarolactone cycloisomerase
MQIERITPHVLRADLRRPFRFSQWSYSQRATMLVSVETADGITGWGEAYGPPEIAAEAIRSFYAPLLAGRDPRDRESLWQLMFARGVDYGQKGIMVAAISALDIALWDIGARAAGMPLYRFLGASAQRSIPCYATGFYFRDTDIQAIAREFAAEAEQHLADGFRAMKLKVGLGVENDLVLIATVRKAIGPSIRLMIDANHAYDPLTAIDLGRRAEQYDLAWFEEPVTPLDPVAYLEVKRALRVPVAGGECEYTRFGFEPLLRTRAVDYAQPDLCACGGISEGLKIAALASLYSVHVTPHAWGTAVGQAAALHFYAARPSHPATLVPESKWIECDRSENPLRYGIVKEPIQLCRGEWLLPQSPGLGIDVVLPER